MGAHLAETAPEERDPAIREASVGLELRFAGAARPDTAADLCGPASARKPLEVLPHAAHAREVVLELCELDLQLPLRGDGVLGEDVEDQLGAVDDACRERVLERPLLRRLQLLVDEKHLSAGARVCVLQLVELAFADVRPRIGACPVLHDVGDRRNTRCPRELSELRELVLVVGAVRENGEQQPALGLRLEPALGIGHGHGRKYAPHPSRR